MMKSDVKEDTSDGAWRVDEENETSYNFSDEKGLWQPKPADILSMFEKLSKESGVPLELQWTCPGRRAPSPQHELDKSDETGMEVDQQETSNEQIQEAEPCAFDFDDSQSDGGVRATTPMRALGGPARTPRTEKRVARMDNIMDSLRKQQMQRAAEREARRAKASPGRTAQGRGRLLKFGSPPNQHQSPKRTEPSDIKTVAMTSKSSESGVEDPFAFSHKVTDEGQTPVSRTAEASTTAATVTTTSVTDSGNVLASTVKEEQMKENVSATNNSLQRVDASSLVTPDQKVELPDGKGDVSADIQAQTDKTACINSSSLQPSGPKDTIVCGENKNSYLDTPASADTETSLVTSTSLTTQSAISITGSSPADIAIKLAGVPSLPLSDTNNTNQALVTISSSTTLPSTNVKEASVTSTSVVTSDSLNVPENTSSDTSLQPVSSDTSDPS